jgi:hypothetical protein
MKSSAPGTLNEGLPCCVTPGMQQQCDFSDGSAMKGQRGDPGRCVASTKHFFFFGGTEGWTQCLTLARQSLYYLSHFSPFPVGHFWDRNSLYVRARLNSNFSVCASPHWWGWQICASIPSHSWDGILQTLWWGWLQTVILQIDLSLPRS